MSKRKTDQPRPTVVACVGDLHAGSTLGLCPLDGVEVDDGGRYSPNASQRQLWAWWCVTSRV